MISGGAVLKPVLIQLSQQPQLQQLATHNSLARRMAHRFVAGETLTEALEVVRQLNERGMMASLDHLGENVSTREEALAAAEDYRRIFEALGRTELRSNASLKLTQLGLDLGDDFAYENTLSVVREAARVQNFVRIDMEGSAYVQRTLDIFYRLYAEHRNVGVVIQAYLRRSANDLERLIEAEARVRLVKGAYLEPAAVAYQSKDEVDAAFVRLMQMLLRRGNYPAIATHDEAMITATKRFAREEGIDRSRFEFQMLYGIRRDLQAQLVDEGYNVRIYVPYGTAWYPYLMRRMAERPANLMFVLGSVAREATPLRAAH